MSLPELNNGDVVFTTSVRAHFFDETGADVLQASFNAGRKRKFMFLVLGSVASGKETTVDLDELLAMNGLQRIPE